MNSKPKRPAYRIIIPNALEGMGFHGVNQILREGIDFHAISTCREMRERGAVLQHKTDKGWETLAY